MKNFLSLYFLLCTFTLLAQPKGKVSGYVYDALKRPFSGIEIVFVAKDSTLYAMFTDENGKYEFSKLDTGKYFVRVEILPFSKTLYEVNIHPKKNILPDIVFDGSLGTTIHVKTTTSAEGKGLRQTSTQYQIQDPEYATEIMDISLETVEIIYDDNERTGRSCTTHSRTVNGEVFDCTTYCSWGRLRYFSGIRIDDLADRKIAPDHISEKKYVPMRN